MVHSAGPKYAAAAAATSKGFQAMPVKKAAPAPAPAPAAKSQQDGAKPKDNGSWGPQFKNKENFKNMHMF